MSRKFRSIYLKSFLILLALLFMSVCHCVNKITESSEKYLIEVRFPTGKKSIYASATYIGHEDSLSLSYLKIFSIQFDSTYTSNDTLYYKGCVKSFIPDTFLIGPYSRNTSISNALAYSDSGSIVVSFDEKWVLYQYSEVMDGYHIFMKAMVDSTIQTDTTYIPTEFYNQFPLFPRIIKPNTQYAIYRPGYEEDFVPVYRYFITDDFTTWSDSYGHNSGLLFSTKQSLFYGDTLNYRGIIDAHGMIISQCYEKMIVTTIEHPEGADTLDYYVINRRIVDYSDAKDLHELSWYADDVMGNGFSLIEEK